MNTSSCAPVEAVDKVKQLQLALDNIEEITVKQDQLIARLTGQEAVNGAEESKNPVYPLAEILDVYPGIIRSKIERSLEQITTINEIIYGN